MDEVDRFISKDYTNTPSCYVCSLRHCYIIVERIKRELNAAPPTNSSIYFSNSKIKTTPSRSNLVNTTYYYSETCNCCQTKKSYITDMSFNAFVDSGFTASPLCEQCQKRHTYIKIDNIGKYFTKKCSPCIEGKIF